MSLHLRVGLSTVGGAKMSAGGNFDVREVFTYPTQFRQLLDLAGCSPISQNCGESARMGESE